MKGLEQLSLHIPISVDKAEIGSIREYFRFCGSRTSAGHFEYARNRAKPNSNCTLLWNLNSSLINISTTNNPKNSFQGYLATSPTTESYTSTVNRSTCILTLFIAPRFKVREQDYCMTQAN
jgi:hypothetical protein